MERGDVMWFILIKLTNMGKFGGAHTALRNITKGLPSSITSNNRGKKLIQESVRGLIKKEFLLTKPSIGEIHVSLNPRKVKEIREFIQKNKK